jgi:CRISPR/Cas system-associated exonuclease Cas4 (RecB family)
MAGSLISAVAYPKARRKYRHGLRFVPVSSIAEQFYCEVKVDHEYTRGEVPTEAKQEGSATHEEVFVMKPTTPAEIVRDIRRKQTVTSTFLAVGKVDKLRIIGRPDAVIFHHGRPRWVVELKTTGRDPGSLWSDQVVQLKTYGLLLEKMGFDTKELDLVLVRLRRQSPLSEDQIETLLEQVTTHLFNDDYQRFELAHHLDLKFFVFPYSRHEAERDVKWAMDYWLEKRAPIPTTYAGRCRSCEYSKVCSFSLAVRE